MKNNKKIALITGAGSGIGKEMALQLALKDVHVLLLGRKLEKLEKVEKQIYDKNGSSTIVKLNLENFNEIDVLGYEMFKKFKKLDFLILNAGILGTLGPLVHQNVEEFEKVINTNLVANFRLIRSLDLLLRKSKMPKILVISSGAANNPKAYWGAYSISKAGLEQMIKIWQAENLKSNLDIKIINPGPTRTKMRSTAMPGEDPNKILSAQKIAKKILFHLENKNLKKLDEIIHIQNKN